MRGRWASTRWTCCKNHRVVLGLYCGSTSSARLAPPGGTIKRCQGYLEVIVISLFSEMYPDIGMRPRIGRAILDIQPCSFASQVISEDSDLYLPYLNRKGTTF